MASSELAALSFELSRERLDKQERVLDEFYAPEGGQEEVHRRLAYDLDRF